jgi:hypothetical protein
LVANQPDLEGLFVTGKLMPVKRKIASSVGMIVAAPTNAACRLPPATCHLPPATCHLPPATCHHLGRPSRCEMVNAGMPPLEDQDQDNRDARACVTPEKT